MLFIKKSYNVVSSQTEVPLTLLNNDQPRCGDEEERCMTPLHFLNFDVINATIRKTQTYVKKKSLLGNIMLNFHQYMIVNNLLA